ncbi:MAG: PAS domain-containing protein, partial [Cyanobacteria bacterium J06635_11]
MWDFLGAIAQPVYIKNADHQWIYVNEAGSTLIGLGAEAIVGRSEADFLPQQLAQQLREQDTLFFRTEQNSTTPLTFEEAYVGE